MHKQVPWKPGDPVCIFAGPEAAIARAT